MKILEIVFDLRPGGAERFALDLSNELSKSNDVILLAIKDDSIEPKKALFYKSELSNRVVYKNLGLPNGYSLGMAWKIFNTIKTIKPEIVHIHGGPMPIYCILAIYFLNKKMKFYQTIHSDIHNGYDTLFYKFLFKTVGYKKRMGFVALSETNYNEMMRVYPNTKGACILNGRAPIIPTISFGSVKIEMDSYKMDKDSKLYLHVGRCNPIKNQLLLVTSFNKFVNNGYNADLVILGDGFDSEFGLKIKDISGSRIHFIGSRKNVSDYMLNVDFFCLSSDFEGMPITILEASLAGVPIVSTPVCGAVDVVHNGVNGCLSSDHTIDGYKSSLEYSFNHFAELKKGAMDMRKTSSYTIETCAKKYLSFFNQ